MAWPRWSTDSHMIDGDAPFGERFLDVPAGQGEARIPVDRTQGRQGGETVRVFAMSAKGRLRVD
ncbi:hypothetical protein FMEAI12_3340015 [Parafrankia sp. Ea1.12]|nr:hypothetical protein FMEAI12_3340015 [Parafrankia sp. Ea1.12]